MGVASSTDASCGDEPAGRSEEHIATGALDSLESIVDIHTLVGRAVGGAVHTCFFHVGRASGEMLPRLVNSTEACDKWADMGAACAQSPPFGRSLLCQVSVVRKSQGLNSSSSNLDPFLNLGQRRDIPAVG
jgi:hypothetical protein